MKQTLRGTANQEVSVVNPATAAIRFVQFAIIAIAFAAVMTAPAHAGQLSLLINGKAFHLDKPANTKLNEENWGAGIQYDFDMTKSKWVPFISGSGFKDSNENMSYYAGGGTVRRFSFGDEKGAPHVDVGVVAFLMVRKDFKDGDPFPGVLPVVSIGTERVALNMTYIPKVDPKMVPIVFLQLRIGLH